MRLEVLVVVCQACGVMRWQVPDPTAVAGVRTMGGAVAFIAVSAAAKTPSR